MRRGAGLGAGILAALVAAAAAAGAGAEGVQNYRAVGDSIPERLAAAMGEPARGRELAIDRQKGNCILCHAIPLAGEEFQGDAAPDLAGIGGRLSPGQIRFRIVDSTRLNADTIMPAYYRVEGLNRVGRDWRGKPVLTAQEVEDVIAFLLTLKN